MEYSLNDKAIIWLNLFDFLTIEKRHRILQFFDEPKDIFSSFKNHYEVFSKIMTPEHYTKMCCALNLNFVDNEIINLDKSKIQVLTYLSPLYPQDFVNYPTYPLALYCKGDVSLIKDFSIAVVGTRKVSKYGAFATEKIVTGLAQAGVTIVSGMATGVDTIAHTIALKNGAKTIAVLGSGFDHIFPKSNFELYQKICENGLVITEYVTSMKPLAYNFPVRNRIIAMLSKGVLMTEAGLKSGAIYTINYGIDYGKEIFIVPGNIDSFSSQGCNQLLKRAQTALTTCAEDILDFFHIEKISHQKPKQTQISMEQKIVLDVIGNNELSFDEIVAKTKLDIKTLIRLLTTLEISGLIKKSAGNFYSRIVKD